MGIKTREAFHRTIKTASGLQTVGEKTGNGIDELKRQAVETQNVGYESENEYAGNQVQETSRRIGRMSVLASDKIGRWGMKQTARNIRRFRNRPIKVKVNPPKQLPPPQRAALPAPKKAIKTAENAAKTSAKTVKMGTKFAKQTAVAVKKAAAATVKAVKVAVKAVIATTKAAIFAIKGIIAAIAAGGWIVVVIILLLCVAGLVVGSVCGMFAQEEKSTYTPSIIQTIKSVEDDYWKRIEDYKSLYSYDNCYVIGSPCDSRFATAVYGAVIGGTKDTGSVKTEKVQEIYENINTVTITLQPREETVSGSDESFETSIRYDLIIKIQPIGKNEVIAIYGLNEAQQAILDLLLSEIADDLWQEANQ